MELALGGGWRRHHHQHHHHRHRYRRDGQGVFRSCFRGRFWLTSCQMADRASRQWGPASLTFTCSQKRSVGSLRCAELWGSRARSPPVMGPMDAGPSAAVVGAGSSGLAGFRRQGCDRPQGPEGHMAELPPGWGAFVLRPPCSAQARSLPWTMGQLPGLWESDVGCLTLCLPPGKPGRVRALRSHCSFLTQSKCPASDAAASCNSGPAVERLLRHFYHPHIFWSREQGTALHLLEVQEKDERWRAINSRGWGLGLCPEGFDRGFSLPTCVSQLDPVPFLCLEFSRLQHNSHSAS